MKITVGTRGGFPAARISAKVAGKLNDSAPGNAASPVLAVIHISCCATVRRSKKRSDGESTSTSPATSFGYVLEYSRAMRPPNECATSTYGPRTRARRGGVGADRRHRSRGTDPVVGVEEPGAMPSFGAGLAVFGRSYVHTRGNFATCGKTVGVGFPKSYGMLQMPPLFTPPAMSTTVGHRAAAFDVHLPRGADRDLLVDGLLLGAVGVAPAAVAPIGIAEVRAIVGGQQPSP